MGLDTLRRALLEEAEAIGNLAGNLGPEFETAIEWICSSPGRLIACGIGKSGHIAKKAAGTFNSTGTPSLFLHAAEAVHGDLGAVSASDVILAYTHSGETDEVIRLFPSFKAMKAKTILITGRRESSAGRLADLVLDTGVVREACPNNLAPTTSTTTMLALSDSLAIAVMERRHFSREDFARFHPSGTLGKRLLLSVRDVMRQGSDLAVVEPASPILLVMKAITSAGAGAACVVFESRLVGFISDGDLRRHFLNDPDPLEANAESIMNRQVATIAPDLLAVEALEAFQNYPRKIGEMPVIEENRLVGLLMLKDLLRSGIV